MASFNNDLFTNRLVPLNAAELACGTGWQIGLLQAEMFLNILTIVPYSYQIPLMPRSMLSFSPVLYVASCLKMIILQLYYFFNMSIYQGTSWNSRCFLN